ncbi:hypothetical protein ABZ027_04160 [Streptomyces sp. NPDC006332]
MPWRLLSVGAASALPGRWSVRVMEQGQRQTALLRQGVAVELR